MYNIYTCDDHPGSILPPGGGSDGWRVGQAMKGGGVDVAIGVVVDMAVGRVDQVVDVTVGEDDQGVGEVVELVAVALGSTNFIKAVSISDKISLKSAAAEGGVVNTGVGTEGPDIPIPEVDVEGGTDVEGEVELEPKVVEDDEVRVGGGEAVLELTVVLVLQLVSS